MANEKTAAAAPQNTDTAKTNMHLYNQLREVPENAKKPITDGRLKGKTDVNPQWRIKRLTEVFGACGFGWKYEIEKMWNEQGDDETVACFVNVNLYVKDPATSQWSEAIPGTGGNIFRRKEKSGNNYIDDDCYKKALTDALSIAAKALGLAADVWFEKDTTSKYESGPAGKGAPSVREKQTTTTVAKQPLTPTSPFWNQSIAIAMNTQDDIATIRKRIESKYTITDADFTKLMQAAGKLQAAA